MDENENKRLVQRKGNKSTVAERNKALLIQAYTTKNPSVEELPLQQIYASVNAAKPKPRVCAYCRVSTENDAQEGSFELQVQEYTQMIQNNPEWEFVGIYKDKGISATSVDKRKGFQDMIQDCIDGKIDLILTKSASRFARNLVDSLHYIRLLKNLSPPEASALRQTIIIRLTNRLKEGWRGSRYRRRKNLPASPMRLSGESEKGMQSVFRAVLACLDTIWMIMATTLLLKRKPKLSVLFLGRI